MKSYDCIKLPLLLFLMMMLFIFSSCENTNEKVLEDKNNCEQINLSFTATIASAQCVTNNGRITVKLNDPEVDKDLMFQINEQKFQYSNTFEGLSEGEYAVTVKNANGCQATQDITVFRILGDSIKISYDKFIKPIIESNCATTSACHKNPSVDRPNFNNEAVIVEKANQILTRVQNGTMPPNNKLEDDDIQLIKCWVESGGSIL